MRANMVHICKQTALIFLSSCFYQSLSINLGHYSGGGTPVPISNTAVKSSSAYGTAGFPGGRVGRCRHSIVGVNVKQPLCRGGEIGRHIRLKI